MKLLKNLNLYVSKIISVITILAFAAMTISTFAQVFFRYVVRSSLPFTAELSRYLFIIVIFTGAVVALKKDSHIKVTLFVDLIKNKTIKFYVEVLSKLLTILFLALFTYYGYESASRILGFGQTASTMPFLQIGYIYTVIPLGSFLMICIVIEQIMELLKNHRGD